MWTIWTPLELKSVSEPIFRWESKLDPHLRNKRGLRSHHFDDPRNPKVLKSDFRDTKVYLNQSSDDGIKRPFISEIQRSWNPTLEIKMRWQFATPQGVNETFTPWHIPKMGICCTTPKFYYYNSAKDVTIRYSLTIKMKGILLCREWARKENLNGRCSWTSVVA